MPVKRVTAVTVPADGRSGVVLDSFPARTPLLILTARLARPADPASCRIHLMRGGPGW
jgi:hypothetical protein